MVREVVGRRLQQLGYETKLVADSQEAVAQFREEQENLQPFACLIQLPDSFPSYGKKKGAP